LRRKVGGIENVLERDRQAAQRQGRKLRRVGGAARRVEIECNESGNILFARGDGLGAKLDGGAWREFAGFDAADEIERGKHQSPFVPFADFAMWPETRNRIKAASHG
jgi:hypothetical protein